MLGGAKDRVLAYASTAMLKDPKEHARDALKYREMGFRAIKIRIHHDRMEDDIASIRAVRDVSEKGRNGNHGRCKPGRDIFRADMVLSRELSKRLGNSKS